MDLRKIYMSCHRVGFAVEMIHLDLLKKKKSVTKPVKASKKITVEHRICV